MRCRHCLYVSIFVALVVLALGFTGSADAATATLDWTDVATNEVGYEIERAQAACSPVPTSFTKIGEVGVNAKTYVDATPLEGYQYCWRVRAYNYKWVGSTNPADKQFSAYSNLAGKDFPLPASAAPTGLTAN